MSTTSGTWQELVFSNDADCAAVNNFSTETSLLTAGIRPFFPAGFFPLTAGGYGKAVTLEFSGVLGVNTATTPTYTFTVRLGTSTTWSSSDTQIGVTAAITTQSGISNKYWYLRLDMSCYAPGVGTGKCTLSGAGYILSPGGFASPFIYPVEPTTPDTATWTVTVDGGLTQYIGISATCSAANSNNTVTVKTFRVHGRN